MLDDLDAPPALCLVAPRSLAIVGPSLPRCLVWSDHSDPTDREVASFFVTRTDRFHTRPFSATDTKPNAPGDPRQGQGQAGGGDPRSFGLPFFKCVYDGRDARTKFKGKEIASTLRHARNPNVWENRE